jgi:hypothetical protein
MENDSSTTSCLTDDALSAKTKNLLLAAFHENPVQVEYWAYIRRHVPTQDALERAALIFLGLEEEAHERLASRASRNLSGLVPVEKVEDGDPRITPASREQIAAAIKMVDYNLSRQPHDDQVSQTAMVVHEHGWTVGEIDAVWRVVTYDPDLVDRVGYSGSVNPSVFAAARSKPRVMQGRLHTEDQVRAFAAKERPGDVNGQNRIFGQWFAPVEWGGQRLFTLRTIAD